MLTQMAHKRAREEEDDDDGLEAFGSDKRRRTFDPEDLPFSFGALPLRNAFPLFPNSSDYRPTSHPATSDESTNGSPESTNSPPEVVFSDDIDMQDDTVSIVESQSPPTPLQPVSRPAKLAPAPYRGQFAESRVPTPIHNTFPGGVPGIPRSSSDVSNMDLEDAVPENVRSPMMGPPPRKTTIQRPMPSPIRESLLSPREALLSPTQNGTMETSIAAASQMSRLSMDGGEKMEVDEGRKSNDLNPPRTGRARSGAIYSQKKTYSMGYREDCPKCRAKVPGHYSHFLPLNEV